MRGLVANEIITPVADMKALRFDGSALGFETDVPRPRRNGEALVRVLYAGICNTDLEIAKGYAGFHGTPGHEFVGRVVESPDPELVGRRVVGEINVGCGSCRLCQEGDPRHCPTRTVLGIKDRDGAFAEYLSLPAGNLIEVPDAIPDEDAVFIEPLAAAFNILEQVAVRASSQVALIGDGKLAQLIARALARTGCDLVVIGKHEAKLKLASKTGARCIELHEIEKKSAAGEFDIVIEASGSPSGLPLALELVKPRGDVVLKSTYHGVANVSLWPVVVNEVRIIGSRCGRFRHAIDALTASLVDLKGLVSEVMPLDDGLRAFERASDPATMKVLLRMEL